MVRPQAARTCSMTSGFNGSPDPQSSRSAPLQLARSSWISRRQTVGGAQNVVTPQRNMASRRLLASKRGWLTANTVAPAFQGANTELQACLAQPGEETFR